MFKSFLLGAVLFTSASALDVLKCDNCSISKEYIKCSIYVETRGDKSKQESCQIYAESLYMANSEARAAWFFLLSGDFDKAIKAGEKGLAVKEFYVAEQIAEAYLLKGDEENAKKYIKILQEHIHGSIFVTKNIKVLARLYPDIFDAKRAKQLFDK